MDFKNSLLIGALSVGVLSGCGSDSDSRESYGADYTGKTSAGAINAETQASYEVMGIEIFTGFSAVLDALNNDPVSGPRSNNPNTNDQYKVKQLKVYLDNLNAESRSLPIGAQIVESGSCGGTMTVSTSDFTQAELESDQAPASMPESYTFTYSFDDFCSSYDNSVTLNGSYSVLIKETESEYYDKLTFNNFKITTSGLEGSETEIWNGYFEVSETESQSIFTAKVSIESSAGRVSVKSVSTCTYNVEAGETCTVAYEFPGSNGITYRLEFDPQYEAAKAYDPRLGFVFMEPGSTELCVAEDGRVQLDTGSSLYLWDETNVLTITATDCGIYSSSLEAIPQEEV